MTRTVALCLLGAVLGVCGVTAQRSKLSFEVASIKPDREPLRVEDVLGGAAVVRALPGGRFEARQVTVDMLLWFAYDLQPYQVVNMPDWLHTDRFTLAAKGPDDASRDQIKVMVQSLLEDRFKLIAHVDSREMRRHALVLARSDRSLGPNLISMEKCSVSAFAEIEKKYPRLVRPIGSGGGAAGCSMSGLDTLADSLTGSLGTPIVDDSGLEGPFYFNITAQVPLPGGNRGRPLSDLSDLPALSTALEEQLGLKLDPRRGPVKVLVIDSVQQPTAN